MGKEEGCSVCGGTETRLVDGFYWCVECGTQDTTVRETLVEHQMLEDGRFAVGRRTKYSIKMKEGVEMSPEWYKWHTYNFVLAGLTEQLVELGAAPSLRMKVLWIWARYVKMYQKKEEMGRSRVLTQFEESGSSSEGEGAERGRPEARCRRGPRLDRVSRQVLVAVLALALNQDRSPLQVSHFTRFVTFRLLAVNDPLRFVPAELRRRHRRLALALQGTLFYCHELPLVMGRLAALLRLGPPRAPDVDALVASQLRELRLPRGLARLVRALVHLLPIPWELNVSSSNRDVPKFPDYETIVLAYIIVALKMCFGLDDDYEVRLSDAVDRINERERRPRAFGRAPEPTARLFSFRAWSAQLQARARLLARDCGPLAWRRNMRTRDLALMEHFEEFTAARAHDDDEAKPPLSDEVTMDLLGRIPQTRAGGVPSLEELRPALAAREPATALARLVAPRLPEERRRLLDEDFTEYSLEYAYRHLKLPTDDRRLRGVGDARKKYCGEIGKHLVSSEGDPAIVYVKNCENKNWTKTKRPTAAHVVKDEGRKGNDRAKDRCDSERESRGDSETESRGESERESRVNSEERESWGAAIGKWEEEVEKLETFEEEMEGVDIFDDDFFDIKIKEEKMENDPPENFNDEPNHMSLYDDLYDNLDGTRRESEDERSRSRSRSRRGRGVFDSDDERDAGARFDPRTFDRAETIKQIMIAAYKKYIGNTSQTPVRFRTTHRAPRDIGVAKPRAEDADRRSRAYIRRREIEDGKAAIDDVVFAYQTSLATDAMHQVAERVRSFVETAEREPELELEREPAPALAPDASSLAMDDSRDVQVIEDNAKNDAEKDDDAFDGPAYDPVYKGNVKFDDKTHDSSQLFLELKDPPAAPAPPLAEDDISFLDDKTLDKDALLAEINRKRCEKYRQRMSWRRKNNNLDHLVDDPESITEYKYWCRHYKYFRNWVTKVVQEEIDSSFPHSFRFVLRECAATLGVAQSHLYQRVCDIERVMLSLLWRPGGGRAGDKRKRSAGAEQQKRKTSRNTKAKVSKSRKSVKHTWDGTSESEVDSDYSDSRDGVSSDAGAAPATQTARRRSARLRRRP